MLVDCALELGVLSTEDLDRLASGEIQRGNDENFSIKTILKIVNLLTNMYSVRKDSTESALKYYLQMRMTMISRGLVCLKGNLLLRL